MVSKYVRLNSKRIAVLIVLLMAMVAQSFAMAQTPTPEVEIIGTVSDMTAQNITVGTQVFDTTGTEIKAGVAVGKLVKVHAIQNTTGNWVAREIELAQPVVTASGTPSLS